MRLRSCTCILILFAITLFEYGSYRIAPVIAAAIFLLIIKDRKIFLPNTYIGTLLLLTLLFVGIFYKFDFDYDRRWLSFTAWSIIAIISSLKIKPGEFIHACSFVIFFHIIFAIIDLILFASLNLDISSLLGVPSRHVTYAKPYVRATGLMAEPGTLAAMILCLSILALPKRTTIFAVFAGVLIIKSPYIVLALIVLLAKKIFTDRLYIKFGRLFFLSLVLLFPVAYVMYFRIMSIFMGDDSSFMSRIDAFEILLESKYLIHGAWFSSSHLVSDIGFIAEVYFQFGIFFGTIISVAIAFNSVILLLVKQKAFVGFLPFFLIYRFKLKNKVSAG